MASSEDFLYSETKRHKPCLIYQGYRYVQDKIQNRTVYWRCEDRTNCNGRSHQSLTDGSHPILTIQHNHPPLLDDLSRHDIIVIDSHRRRRRETPSQHPLVAKGKTNEREFCCRNPREKLHKFAFVDDSSKHTRRRSPTFIPRSSMVMTREMGHPNVRSVLFSAICCTFLTHHPLMKLKGKCREEKKKRGEREERKGSVRASSLRRENRQMRRQPMGGG